jgi:hypothetical protein
LAEKAQKNLKLVESKLVNLLNATATFLIESYEDYFNQILQDPGNNNDEWKVSEIEEITVKGVAQVY